MSFFGGNTSLGATSTPAKPGGLFSSFGVGPTSNTAPAFGGQQQQPTAAPGFVQQAPSFGATGFGATNTAQNTGAVPQLGGFSTGFGATSNAATTGAQPSLFGGTGQTAATTSAQNAFGGFGLGAAQPNQQSAGFGGFGASATTTSAPAFSGFGTNSAFGGNTSSAFGANQPSAFGSTFGKTISTVTPGFGGFGGNTNFMLGQPQQQAPQVSADEAFAQSILNVAIFGDERDNIIAKWNYLQAMWGTGKLFYSQSAAPVDITQENYLCRFKAMGYSRMPGKDNKLGLVALNMNKSITDMKTQQPQLVQALHSLFGSKPNVMVFIEACKELEEKKCQVVIYVEEKSQIVPNESKRILATDVANYLGQPNVRQQLNNLGITEALALVLPDADQLKEYLDNSPKGVDPRMWCQAKQDNPDPTQFIPVPMVGFHDLRWRVKCQEQEADTHALYLKKLDKDLAELRRRHTAANSKILEHKRKLAELSHRILKVIVKQECTRKFGLVLSSEEEALRTKLENMQAMLSAPTQFKGRLSELLSQMRMQSSQFAVNGSTEYTIDKESEIELKTYLTMQQKAIAALIGTVNKDMKALDIIYQGLPELKK